MPESPERIPVTDLAHDAASVVRRVRKGKTPVVITDRGRAAAVLLSMDSYKQAKREREILLQLARGEMEIAAGEGYDLDSVLAETDEFLAGK